MSTTSSSTPSGFTDDVIKAIEALLNALRLKDTKWADINKAKEILIKLQGEEPIDKGSGPGGGG